MRHDFKKLKIWNDSMDLVVFIYKMIALFPKEEMYALSSQIIRCVVSIPSNIAEGSGRSSDKDFANFLHYSYGSSCELETQIELAHRLGYISLVQQEEVFDSIHQIQKMIFKFKDKLILNR